MKQEQWQLYAISPNGDYQIRVKNDVETLVGTATSRKDGQLMAAAPDLLTAAEAVLLDLDSLPISSQDIVEYKTQQILRAAITKAKGDE